VAWIILEMENEEKGVDEWGVPWGVQSRLFDRLLYQCITTHEFTRLKDASGSGFLFSVLL
jgi:hypothetical protein